MKKIITKVTTVQSLLSTKLIAILMALGVFTFTSCSDDDVIEQEDVIPTAAFSFTQNQYEVQFSNGSLLVDTYSWDFGDEEGTSEESSPTYTYTAAGTYTATLTVTSKTGNINAISQDVTVILTPSAVFDISDTTFLEVTVDASASSDVATYSWDFGDGSSALTEQVVTYEYAEAGEKTITLTTTSSDGVTSSSELIIDLSAAVPAEPDFSFLVIGLEVSFDENSNNAVGDDYSWDFGDGTGTSTDQNPTYTYADVGDYEVTLTVKGENGEDYTTTQTVTAIILEFTGFINGTFDDFGLDANRVGKGGDDSVTDDDYNKNNDIWETPDWWVDDTYFDRAGGMTSDGKKADDDSKTNGMKFKEVTRGAYQEIYVEIGDSYTMSVDIAAENTTSTASLLDIYLLNERITQKSDIVADNTIDEVNIMATDSQGKGNFTTYTITFTATTSTVVLYMQETAETKDDTTEIWVDNIVIVENP